MRISSALGIPAISTGEMLRQAVAKGSDLGRRVASTMAAGLLVEDTMMAEVVSERLSRADAARGFVLDGYPRNPAQAENLDSLLTESGREVNFVVLFEVPEEVVIRRALARRRTDDREVVIRKRLALYHQETEPLVDYYARRGVVRRIDGSRSIDAVSKSILESLPDRGH